MTKNVKLNNNSAAYYWNRLAVISFVLAIMVVFRHNSALANYQDFGVITDKAVWLCDKIKYSLTELAVPMFFVISGYNYYYRFKIKSYPIKLFRRVKSLVIPYLFWNIIYCIFCIVTSNTFVSKYFIGREKFEITVKNVLLACVYHKSCNGHFWFIFNLILFSILAPLIYLLFKNKWVGLASFAICYYIVFFSEVKLPGDFLYRLDSVLYYFVGVYLALHKDEILSLSVIAKLELFWLNHKFCGI